MIDESNARYLKGEASDHDLKLFGTVALEGRDTPLYKRIQAIIEHYTNVESLNHITHYPNDVKVHSFTMLCGMKYIIHELDKDIKAMEQIIEQEKKEIEEGQQEEAPSPLSYGEGFETSDMSNLTT